MSQGALNIVRADDLQVLLDWINDELADHRIIVKDIEEDLFDGQILQKLIGASLLHVVCSFLFILYVSSSHSVSVSVCLSLFTYLTL